MRVLVCGGRDYQEQDVLNATLDEIDSTMGGINLIIHGMSRGADALADFWAITNVVPVLRFPAYWEAMGKAAGPRRNQQMLNEGQPDLVAAFPGGKGTADMVGRAIKAGVIVIHAKGEVLVAP